MFDRTEDGRAVKILNIIDGYGRFNVYMEVDSSFAGNDAVEAFGRLMVKYDLLPICPDWTVGDWRSRRDSNPRPLA